MDIKYNRSFAKLIDVNNLYLQMVTLEGELINLVENRIIKKCDCYYFDFLLPKGSISPDFIDKTGNEAFFNKIIIEDYVDYEGINCIPMGVSFAIALYKSLTFKFVDKFTVIYSFDGSYSSVTFHKIRHGESWLTSDLEEYKLNSILILKD